MVSCRLTGFRQPRRTRLSSPAAWNNSKGRREGAAYGARRRAYKKAAPQREAERVERVQQVQREIREEEDARPEVQARRAKLTRAGKIPRRSTRKRRQPPRGSGMPDYSSDDMEMLYD